MKLKIFFGLIALTLAVITVQAIEPAQVQMFTDNAVEFVRDHSYVAMAAPVIISSKITPEIIEDMKLKYKRVKLITVVMEPAIYDIDELTSKDKANLRRLGIDMDVLLNREIELAERLVSLEKLKELKDYEDSKKIIDQLPPLSGELIEEAEKYQFIVRRPDRGLTRMLTDLAAKKKIDELMDKAVKNLVVGGDMEALEDGIVFASVFKRLETFLSPARSFLSRA